MEKGEKGGMSGKGVWAHLFRKQGVGFRKGGCLFSNAGGLSNRGGLSNGRGASNGWWFGTAASGGVGGGWAVVTE